MRTGIDPETKTIVLDNYSLALFRSCPRKYQHRILQGYQPLPIDYRPEQEEAPLPAALGFGLGIHEALDMLYASQNLNSALRKFQEVYTNPGEDSKRTVERGVELLTEYRAKWKSDDERIDQLICETTAGTQIGQIEDYAVMYYGRIDKVEFSNGRWLCKDHKTSSWESQYLATAYEQSQQFLGYFYLTKEALKIPCEGIIVDILLMKPKNNDFIRYEIRPSSAQIQEWQRNILTQAGMLLQCYKQEFFPQYGHPACAEWNKICPFFLICNTQEHREAIEESQFKEDYWEPDKQ